MNSILESIKPVIKKSKYVKINKENLKRICSKFRPEDVKHWMDDLRF